MRILVFGDSITQGFYDPEKGGWVNRLEQLEQQRTIDSNWGRSITFFNLGISGGRTCDLVTRFETELLARKDTQELVTVLATGANDSIKNESTKENWCPFEEFSQNYEWLITEGKKHGKVITIGITPMQEELLTPIPWFADHSYYQSERDRYDDEIVRLSKLHDVLHISMEDIFDRNLARYLIDGIHPNAEGHQLIFERVKDVLEREGVIQEVSKPH